MIKKALFGLLLLSFIGTARCYNADFASAVGGLPIVGPIVVPTQPVPEYVKAIGTPAAATLPEAKYEAWFSAEEGADPLDVAVWKEIEAFVPIASSKAGWAEACKAVGAVAGGDRAANANLGALACSSDATVTQMQQFAVKVLGAQAAVALWIKGELNGSTGAIQARQAELRVLCATSVIARQGPAATTWTDACEKVMDASYLEGDGPATFTAIGEAYAAVAAELAILDPEIDQEPGYFGATDASATATP
ncbi:MAG: hypothetical protein AB7J35_18495 [Dehalococcoidia bacterium]